MIVTRKTLVYCVGVDEYKEYQTLSCCANDAIAVARQLKHKLPGGRVSLLHSGADSPELPTKANVDAFMQEISELQLDAQDLVVFYFAGHGFSSAGRDYLVCMDTQRDNPGTAVMTDQVIAALNGSGAGTCVLIIDACRVKLERDAGLFGEQTAELARRQGVIVFFGCSPGQVCQELPKLGNGIFTYSLLSAIEDVSVATPLEIDRYVLKKVEDLYQEHKLGRQQPYTSVAPIQKAVVDIFTGQPVVADPSRARRCILIVGPANAGKTTLGQHLSSRLGFLHMEMSSFAWRRLHDRPDFTGSIQDFMEQVVWAEQDRDIIAHDLLSSLPSNLDKIVICGPRTVEEIEAIRKQNWDITTVFLFANANVRYGRYATSGQMNRYRLGYRELVERDLREFSWGMAKAATMPKVEIIINESTLPTLFERVGSGLIQG